MALKYKGHVFDTGPACTCCVGDARMVADDPTGTRPIRKDFLRATTIKWQQVKSVVREMIITADFLQLKAGGLLSLTGAANPALFGGGDKVQMFQRWFDTVLDRVVLESSGSYLGPFVKRAYEAGQSFAQATVNVGFVNINAQAREDTIRALAVVELQGVMEAVSQQAVRAVANGLLNNLKPIQIVREISERIDKIGVVRTRTMIELITVKAFGDATLDVYSAVGVQQVGLIPEVRNTPKVIADARKATRRGAGSRSSRKRTPSASTIGRIEEQEEALERLGRVRVRTAGDDDVCPVCERIAANGPYDIDKARSLIPAHPRCRCVFIPANDKRYRENREATKRVAPKRPRTARDPAEPVAPPRTKKPATRRPKAVESPPPKPKPFVPPRTESGLAKARRELEAQEKREAAAREALLNRNAVAQVAEMEARFARMKARGRKPTPEQQAKLKRLKARAKKALGDSGAQEGLATFGTSTSFAEGEHKRGTRKPRVPKKKAKAVKKKRPRKK